MTNNLALDVSVIHSKKTNKDYFALVAYNFANDNFVIIKWLSHSEYEKLLPVVNK